MLLFFFYCVLSHLSRGEDAWWYIDFVSNGNIYWGDDAYRYFLARSAWIKPDIYWFNFTLPVWVFLDGVVVTLSADHLIYARYIKAVLTVLSIFFVYKSCIYLKSDFYSAIISTALLALLPLYFFVSMSFYAESWLSFLISFSMFLYFSGRLTAAYLVIAILPLVRAEGVFFVASFFTLGVIRKDWKMLLLPVSAGAVYFLLIILVGPGIEVFSGWRFNMMNVYAAADNWYGGSLTKFLDVFYLPWALAAALAFLWRSSRSAFPFFSASVVMILFVAISVFLKKTNFEPRYLAPVMPVLAVGFSLFLSKLTEFFIRNNMFGYGFFIALVLVVSTFFYQFFSIYVFSEIKNYYLENKRLPSAVIENPSDMASYFKGMSAREIDQYREFAHVVTEMLKANRNIKTLIVSNFIVFNFLEPNEIPSDVMVVFSIFGRGRLGSILGGDKAAGYFAERPYFGYFSLSYPQKNEEQILYLDRIPLVNYPYHWQVGSNGHVGANDIYLFGGKLLLPP